MEMTDIEGLEDQGQGSSDKRPDTDQHGPERQPSVQRGLGTPKQLLHGSLPNVEGLEDFAEFVLDFDDYDLLESIHTQLGSPQESVRKSSGFYGDPPSAS